MELKDRVSRLSPERRKEILKAMKDTEEFKLLIEDVFGERFTGLKSEIEELKNALRGKDIPNEEETERGLFDD
jgi:hypothetical protein